jgi:hypothetical protein
MSRSGGHALARNSGRKVEVDEAHGAGHQTDTGGS